MQNEERRMPIDYITSYINRRALSVTPTRYRGWYCLAVVACTLFVFAPSTAAQVSPRSRESFNSGWRFQKDDPAGAEGRLSYEKIKESVTATGGEFVAGAAKSARADEGLILTDVAYTRREFDDSAWRRLDLPHDWGIEGPFKQEYPGETGKLAWWGVGWYRKHFEVPAADRGKQ